MDPWSHHGRDSTVAVSVVAAAAAAVAGPSISVVRVAAGAAEFVVAYPLRSRYSRCSKTGWMENVCWYETSLASPSNPIVGDHRLAEEEHLQYLLVVGQWKLQGVDT